MASAQTTSSGMKYIGNPDFRGYVNAVAPQYLAYVGNDGGINSTKLQNSFLAHGVDQDLLGSMYSTAKNNIGQLYSQYQGYAAKPGAYSTSGSGSSGSLSSSGSSSYDPTAVSYFDGLIGNEQGAINRLGNQSTIGHQNIEDSYNSAYNKLLGQKASATRDYNTSKVQSAQDNITARNNIDASVGNQTNALERLLGSHGAGSSSAATIVAPWAAARQGTVQRNQVAQTYARNNQSLDTNFGDFTRNWDGSVSDLKHQKDTQSNALDASIAQNKADLLSQIASLQAQKTLAATGSYSGAASAMAPYQQQASNLLTQVDNLGRQYANPVIQASDVKYTAPTLSQYNFDQAAAPTIANDSAYTDSITPYLSLLTGNKDKNNTVLA